MKKFIILLIFLLFFDASLCYALDWITIHNRAGSLTSKEIFSGAIYPKGSVEDYYLLGLSALNEYNPDEALVYFSEVLKVSPGSFEAQWGIAEVLRRKHKLDESQKDLEEIIKNHPDFAPAYLTLAYIKYLKLAFTKAAAIAHKAIDMGPDKIDKPNYVRAFGLYAACKGMLAHNGGPVSKIANGMAVIKYLNSGKKIDPESATVNFGYGAYYMLIPGILGKDLNKAEEYLKKAIAKEPKFSDPYVRLAQIYKERKDYAKYDLYLNKALELDPQNELALDVKEGRCNFICVPYKGQDDRK
ncbi:MAG: hypothetical protein HQL27_03975 [Candidatus Omnitrophica bacterium]|nr:hypothetical protein [Candidatus Omnitrophota bacterium]